MNENNQDASFLSMEDLHVEHSKLLKKYRSEVTNPNASATQNPTFKREEIKADIENFLRHGKWFGRLLATEQERWEAQSILDYWATSLYRLSFELQDTTLDEYDSNAPDELPPTRYPYSEANLNNTPAKQILLHPDDESTSDLSAADIRAAIQEPADKQGLKYADGLVTEITNQALGEVAGLEVLLELLRDLWDKREKNLITWEAYRKVLPNIQPLRERKRKRYQIVKAAKQWQASQKDSDLLLGALLPSEAVSKELELDDTTKEFLNRSRDHALKLARLQVEALQFALHQSEKRIEELHTVAKTLKKLRVVYGSVILLSMVSFPLIFLSGSLSRAGTGFAAIFVVAFVLLPLIWERLNQANKRMQTALEEKNSLSPDLKQALNQENHTLSLPPSKVSESKEKITNV